MTDEFWTEITEFPDYEISNLGNIWKIGAHGPMEISFTDRGYAKISLVNTKGRQTRSVARLTALAWVSAPYPYCTDVMVLNGNQRDLRADNLVWRPRWFVHRYAWQFSHAIPLHYQNLKVVDNNTGEIYDSIIDAATKNGLLFYDIWRSINEELTVIPLMHTFSVYR